VAFQCSRALVAVPEALVVAGCIDSGINANPEKRIVRYCQELVKKDSKAKEREVIEEEERYDGRQ
jgi:hypothetical protein